MTTHRFVVQVRRALDLETDAQAMRWTVMAIAAYLGAIGNEKLRAQIASELPDRLALATRHTERDAGPVPPVPSVLADLLSCSDRTADHLLRVVWALFQDTISPSDLEMVRTSFPDDLVDRLDEYDRLAEEEEDALHGDVAVYQYESDDPVSGAELSGGDLDAAWNDAEGGGEETVGGSAVTPDQDIVDELGEAVGVTYRSDEVLRPAEKESDRDRSRWEMDPASSEDYKSRAHPRPKRLRRKRR